MNFPDPPMVSIIRSGLLLCDKSEKSLNQGYFLTLKFLFLFLFLALIETILNFVLSRVYEFFSKSFTT